MRPFLFLTALASCTPTVSNDDTSADADTDTDTDTDTDIEVELAEKRAEWDSCGFTSYSFVLQYHCFCPDEMTGPALVDVENGSMPSAVYVSDGSPVTSDFDVRDIPGLFDLIGEALAAPADQVTVTWDGSCGYPVDAYFDYDINSDDDELGFSVTEWTPVE